MGISISKLSFVQFFNRLIDRDARPATVPDKFHKVSDALLVRGSLFARE